MNISFLLILSLPGLTLNSMHTSKVPWSMSILDAMCVLGLKVPSSYCVRAMGEFALLMYMSGFRFQVRMASTSDVS